MDDRQITEGLRGLAIAEPLLGFDPDDVATKAAKRLRNRRASLISGVGTLAVIAAAAAVTFVAPGHGSVQAAAPATRPTSAATATSPAPVRSPNGNLAEQMARNRQHLRDVVGTVLTGAKDIDVSEFVQPYKNDIVMFTVSYRDGTGPGSFNLTITGPSASNEMTTLADQCNPHAFDPRGNPIQQPKGPDGKPLRCDKLSRPDGSTVVVQELVQELATLQVDPNAPAKVKALSAIHYRTDGTTVNIWNDLFISVNLAARYGQLNPDGTGRPSIRPQPPLTEQQMIALVTDPAFNVK